ncbi:MAG: YicC family protein [Clostridia bacterium]|nr:YicC family protein [Clostridia bacterium]
MIKSMTGYGRAVLEKEGMELTFEVKSVNNRYLDTSVRFPRAYGYLEDKIKKEVGAHTTRGKVDCYLGINVLEDTLTKVSVNHALLESYLAVFREVEEKYSLRDDIGVSVVTRLPDVIGTRSEEEDEEKMFALVREVMDKALADYDTMRAAEGKKLYDDILLKLDRIEEIRQEIIKLSPASVKAYEERLRQRIEELLGNTSYDENRVITEVALFADKVAVDEEITRLASHLSQFKDIMKGNAPAGRKLDFLTQEINREVNTIGSKCQELEITRLVVDAKSEIEKIREQIQNIE